MYVHMELTSQPNDDTFLNIHQFHGSLLLAIMAPNPSPPQRKFEHPASSHAKKKFVQFTFYLVHALLPLIRMYWLMAHVKC